MKYITSAALSVLTIFAGMSIADAATKSPNSKVRLSSAECSALWQQANPGSAKGLTEAQASAFISNFKAANPDGDATIDAKEWRAACRKGLVKSASSTGASSGESGTTKMAPSSKQQ